MIFPRIFIVILAAIILTSCGNKTDNKIEERKVSETMGPKVAPIVSYCMNLDYSDTVSLRSKKVMGRIIKLMKSSDSLSIRTALTTFFNNLNKDGKSVFAADSIATLYLANPASPIRNGELYIQYLQSMLSVGSIPDEARQRAEYNLRIALLNRLGTVANDFRFKDREGKEGSLHSLSGSDILLVFYDPECPHCGEILTQIADSPRINSAIELGNLTVLAIYAEGKRDVWERTKNDLPLNWLVGFDLSKILDNGLYDLPAMPLIYLLSPDKRVVLKDPDVSLLLKRFR